MQIRLPLILQEDFGVQNPLIVTSESRRLLVPFEQCGGRKNMPKKILKHFSMFVLRKI